MMKRYEKYKNSGVDWIEEIPDHWTSLQLKRIAMVETGTTPPKDDIANYSEDGLPWIKPDDLNEFIPVKDSKEKLSEKGSALTSIVTRGAVLVCGIGSIGKFGIAGCDLATNQQIHSVIFSRGKVIPDFGKYLIAASKSQLEVWSNRVVVSILTKSTLLDIVYAVPTVPEQDVISSYLDRKTSQINHLIAQKEKLITLLQEKRQAVINEAVTRGLNKNVKLKDSDIEWLGKIPAHWEVKKLKYCLSQILGGGTPDTENDKYWNGNIPWVSPKDMKIDIISKTQDYVTEIALSNSASSLIPADSVLVVVRSGILKHTFPVAINKVVVALNQDMKALVPNDLMISRYLFILLKGLEKEILTTCSKIGATVDSIESSWLFDFQIPVPPNDEQEKITTYVSKESGQIHSAIGKINAQIQKLSEYRQSLISEVVTGKVDVREKNQK